MLYTLVGRYGSEFEALESALRLSSNNKTALLLGVMQCVAEENYKKGIEFVGRYQGVLESEMEKDLKERMQQMELNYSVEKEEAFYSII